MNGSHYFQLRDKNGNPIPNAYRIQIYNGRGPDGKPRRHCEIFRGRVGDLKKHIAELVHTLNKGVPMPTGRLTVAEHLDQWLEGYVKTNCCPRTYDGYEGIVRKHLAPALGHIQVKDLQPAIIQRYYGQECSRVSPRSVHHYHRALSQSLKYAVRQGYLGRNPCELVDPPSWKGKTMRTLTPGEVGMLLETAEGNPHYPMIYTALNTGLRQAELLGLRWRDIDLDVLSISVSRVLYKRRGSCEFKEPKTERSRRKVKMTPKLALYLKSYKAEQEAFYWQHMEKPLALDCLVFTTPDGKPIDPSVLSHTFNKLAKRAGLEGVRFHDLRHSFASIALMRGAKPKVISEALGHSSVAFTMDVYSHIIDGMQEEAMALLDEVLPAGVSRKNNTEITPTFSN